MTAFLNPLRRAWHSTKRRLKKLAYGGAHVAPGFIVLGAQKGGTTALFEYLSSHPNIEAPHPKEQDYFCALGAGGRPCADEYHRSFPFVYGADAHKRVSMDVSPAYLLDAKVVAPAIYSYNPQAKIIATLREPVSRAVSAWFMYKKLYHLNPNWFTELSWVKNTTNQNVEIHPRASFGESFLFDMQAEIDCLNSGGRIDMPIVEYGLYEQQLASYFDLFDETNILVLDSAELNSDTQNILDQVTDHACLPRHDLGLQSLDKHFVGDNKKPIAAAELAPLQEFYAAHNTGLSQLSGRSFGWQSNTEGGGA